MTHQLEILFHFQTRRNCIACFSRVLLFVFSANACAWNVVNAATDKLLEVPLPVLKSVPVGMVGPTNPQQPQATEHVEVIPMQEELEVRLEEGNFPVPTEWNYDVRMDSDMVAAALGQAQVQRAMVKPMQPYQVG